MIRDATEPRVDVRARHRLHDRRALRLAVRRGEAVAASVLHDGACDDEGEGAFCGGIAGVQCPEGEFCNFPIEAQCGAADQGGTCQAKPEVCTLQYDPVCGCDDKTYGNACAAAGAGVSIAHDGECKS